VKWEDAPVVIVVAPTGAEVTRAQQPALPHTPREIADETARAVAAGASVVHIHVREPDGKPSARTELFVEAIARIRAGGDVICMVSTGGSVEMTIDERLTGLDASPDLAGIETGSLNFGDDVFITPRSAARRIAKIAAERGIALEVEAFDVGHIHQAIHMLENRELPDPLRVNCVFGVPGGIAATPEALDAMRRALPGRTPWTVTAIGRYQRRMIALGILVGATGVRVGFEDNVYLRKGVRASSNAELVADVVQLIRELGREPATVAEARRLLALAGDQARLDAPKS
jgi:3-keto-5-aminohexanoate cleavage enzyme